MKYGLISYNSPKDLVQKVNESIKKGWKPLGGVSQDGGSYMQAIVNNSLDPDQEEKKK